MSEQEWLCRTVYVSHYSDGIDPKYALVRDATVWNGAGPNGHSMGAVDTVTFEGAEVKPEDRVRFGDWHRGCNEGRNLRVSVDDGVATITVIDNEDTEQEGDEGGE